MALAWHLSNVAAYADDRKRSERLWREGIVEARDAGATLAEIAAAAGVTDGRIWQICNDHKGEE